MAKPKPDSSATSAGKTPISSYTRPKGYTAAGYGGSGSGGFGTKLYAWTPVHRRAPGEAGLGDDWPPGRPLRVVHVGPGLAHGGAENWLIDLARFLDPDRLRVERTVALNPDGVDPSLVARLPIPYEDGGPEAVRRAAADCDVLLAWGLPQIGRAHV